MGGVCCEEEEGRGGGKGSRGRGDVYERQGCVCDVCVCTVGVCVGCVCTGCMCTWCVCTWCVRTWCVRTCAYVCVRVRTCASLRTCVRAYVRPCSLLYTFHAASELDSVDLVARVHLTSAHLS